MATKDHTEYDLCGHQCYKDSRCFPHRTSLRRKKQGKSDIMFRIPGFEAALFKVITLIGSLLCDGTKGCCSYLTLWATSIIYTMSYQYHLHHELPVSSNTVSYQYHLHHELPVPLNNVRYHYHKLVGINIQFWHLHFTTKSINLRIIYILCALKTDCTHEREIVVFHTFGLLLLWHCCKLWYAESCHIRSCQRNWNCFEGSIIDFCWSRCK